MKKLFVKVKNFLPTRRKIIQLYCAVLFNANLKGFVSGSIYKGNSKILCAPGINCYSCPGAIAACPLGTLQGAISSDRSTIYYVFGTLLLYSLLFGR
ncbi:MAG: 4Fe-4S binding protein, partial [Agathobacter sp.]|nr:4Fe-4S binding protein [Agathobacter sp.]